MFSGCEVKFRRTAGDVFLELVDERIAKAGLDVHLVDQTQFIKTLTANDIAAVVDHIMKEVNDV